MVFACAVRRWIAARTFVSIRAVVGDGVRYGSVPETGKVWEIPRIPESRRFKNADGSIYREKTI